MPSGDQNYQHGGPGDHGDIPTTIAVGPAPPPLTVEDRLARIERRLDHLQKGVEMLVEAVIGSNPLAQPEVTIFDVAATSGLGEPLPPPEPYVPRRDPANTQET